MEPDRGCGVRGIHDSVWKKFPYGSEIRKLCEKFYLSYSTLVRRLTHLCLSLRCARTGEDEVHPGGDRVLLRLEEDQPLQGMEEELCARRPGDPLRVRRLSRVGGACTL